MQDLNAESDLNTGTVVPGESQPAPQPIEREDRADTHDEPAERSTDTEDRARAMGWVPKEEFRGPAENWRDADAFVKKGEEDLPVVRERLRDATRKVADFERKLRETEQQQQQNFAKLERMTDLALRRQRQQIEANYEAAQREAVGLADTARFDQLERDKRLALQHHDKQATEAYQPPVPQGQQGQQGQQQPAPPEVEKWVEQNRWFTADAEMAAVATAYHGRLNQTKPGLSLEENLRETTAYVRSRYPDKFGTQVRTGTSPVEGGSRLANGGGTRAKGINELPRDARQMGEKFVRDGLFKDLGEYARDYWSQD